MKKRKMSKKQRLVRIGKKLDKAQRSRTTIQRVMFTTFQIAGMQFSSRELGDVLEVGERINLIAVDNNPHDPFAIVVERGRGGELGWFPRIEKEQDGIRFRTAGQLHTTLHRLLKTGVQFEAEISDVRNGLPAWVTVFTDMKVRS